MRSVLLAWLFLFPIAGVYAAENSQVEKPLSWETPSDNDLRILQVKLGKYLLEDIVTAYQYKTGIYLPLGLFSQAVGLAIEAHPDTGIAEGFIINENRRFYLDFTRKELTVSGVTTKLEEGDIKLFQDDIYLHQSVYEKVFPLSMSVDLFSLQLNVNPTEPFPLQSKKEREVRVSKIRSQTGAQDRGYDTYVSDYQNWEYPFIDVSMGLGYRQAPDGTIYSDLSYSTYLTTDLGKLETAAYIAGDSTDMFKNSRITFARHDPNAGLLGGMNATEYSFGYVNLPSISNISQHQSYLPGFSISNFALDQQSGFESHTFQGTLLPGWEVELYQNEILIGYVSLPVNGEYRFDNVPLLLGNNYFRLAFYGPRGETREETYTFILNNTLTKEGAFHYRIGAANDIDSNTMRTQVQTDYGLNKNLTTYANLATLNLTDGEHSYVNVGLAGFLNYLYGRVGYTMDTTGGTMMDMSLQTRLGNSNFTLTQALLEDFQSETQVESSDPIVSTSSLRIDTAIPRSIIPRIPVLLAYKQDNFLSGGYRNELTNRLSMYTKELAVVNEITDVSSTVGVNATTGALSLSAHRFAYSLRGELNYEIAPTSDISSISLNYTAKNLGPYSYDVGLSRFTGDVFQYILGIHKRSDIYAYDMSIGYKTDGEVSFNTSMSINFAHDKKKDAWKTSSNPMAAKGAASITVFLDENYNGIQDPDEKGLKDIDIELNGIRRFVKTDENGQVFLTDLAVYQPLDLAVSLDSLVDPLYIPKLKGIRSVYRPGHVHEYSFPIILTGEIDGTTFITQKGKTRNVGDVELELLDSEGKVVKSVKSAYDGFYVISQIPAGVYTLRIAAEQKKRLHLTVSDKTITLKQDEMFINGADFVIGLK